MSYDSCKLCGKFAKEPYKAMEEACDKPECPGAAKRKAFREVMGRFTASATSGEATAAQGAWRSMSSAPTSRPIILLWRTAPWPLRGEWSIDEEFDTRSKGWVSPESGWRNDGDQCIPRNQEDCIGWQELPAAPSPAAPVRGLPLTEEQLVSCLVEASCIGTVKMSYETGPYDITRPSINASKLASAIEKAHGIGSPAPGGDGETPR